MPGKPQAGDGFRAGRGNMSASLCHQVLHIWACPRNKGSDPDPKSLGAVRRPAGPSGGTRDHTSTNPRRTDLQGSLQVAPPRCTPEAPLSAVDKGLRLRSAGSRAPEGGAAQQRGKRGTSSPRAPGNGLLRLPPAPPRPHTSVWVVGVVYSPHRDRPQST